MEKPFRGGNFMAAIVAIWATDLIYMTLWLRSGGGSINWSSHEGLSAGVLAYMYAGPVLDTFFTIVVLKWKKWGMYGLGVASLIFSGHFVVSVPEFVFLCFVVRPFWKYME